MTPPTPRILPITVVQTSAAHDRPAYEIRGPAGDVLHTTRSQTQLRDALLGLARQCAPEERLAITVDWRTARRGPVGGLVCATQAAGGISSCSASVSLIGPAR
jgi:hypothetical protein